MSLLRGLFNAFSVGINKQSLMRGILAVSVLIFALCIAATGQKSATQTRDSKVGQELMQMERDWSEAYLRHDIAAIDRILADDYVGTDGRGIMTTKAQEIEEAKPPKPGNPLPPFAVLDESVTDMRVRIYGNVAVVNGRVIEKIKAEEKEAETQYRRTTVWVKREGRWQCVSFHGSRIQKPQ